MLCAMKSCVSGLKQRYENDDIPKDANQDLGVGMDTDSDGRVG